jgi:poly(A) polymerase
MPEEPVQLRVPDLEAARRSRAVAQRLRAAGHVAYWAGGCVRDLLLGREPKDFDLATSATPDQVLELFPHAKTVGKAFGVVLIHDAPFDFEVATFREDLAYRDGRRPEGVVFSSPEADALRRDFTITGMFCDPADGRLHDFVGGVADLRARLVRAIGDPAARFAEDYLRMLRAVRFAGTLEFDLDPATAQAIRGLAPRIAAISAERIAQELTRTLTESPRAGRALRLLRDTGLLEVILPEVARMAGVEQPPEHHPEGDVFTHTALMLDAMERPSAELAYSVLLHDVGKPPTFRRVPTPEGGEKIVFHGHATVGADMAREILERLRMPNALIEAVVFSVANHMRFMEVTRMRPATLRRLLSAPTFPTELELHRLDCRCSHEDLSNHEFLIAARAAYENEPVLPDPWVTGHDLIALGVPVGPEIRRWKDLAYEAQLERRFESREELLAWLRSELDRNAPPSGPI